jgi:Fe-S cluster assembly protein SufB
MPDTSTEYLHEVADTDYAYGFTTEIETEIAPAGLTEDTVRFISAKKGGTGMVTSMEIASV